MGNFELTFVTWLIVVRKRRKRKALSSLTSARNRLLKYADRRCIDEVMEAQSFKECMVHLLMTFLFLVKIKDRHEVTRNLVFFSSVYVKTETMDKKGVCWTENL